MRTPITVAIVILAGSGLLAIQSRPQHTPQFRTGVDVVQLDVSVFDKDHHPIKGLKAEDFTVLEDKLERPLAGFAEVDIPESPPPSAAWIRDAGRDVATNDVADKRLFLLFVDDASFGVHDGPELEKTVSDVKEAVRRFIRRLGPTDLAALIFTGDNRRSQDFTSDHARLLAAVDRLWAPTLPPSLYFRYSAEVLRSAADYLLGVPGKRKAFVDFTGYDIDMTTEYCPQRSEDKPEGICAQMTARNYARAQTQLIFESAQRAGINVFIERPSASIDLMRASNASDAKLAGVNDHLQFDEGLLVGNLKLIDPEARWLTRLPKETGGELFLGVSDPRRAEEAAKSIFEAMSSYYMLGYTSADMRKFHFIKVLVNRPGAEVRTRDKYYWPEKPPVPPPAGALGAMAGLLPKSDLPMRVTVAPFASSNGASLAIALGVHHAREGGGRTVREKLDVRVGTFTAEGTPRGSEERALPLTLPASRGDLDYELLTRVEIAKPGLYELRLSAHSSVLAKDGAVYVTVDVPDFSKAPISMSGIVVSGDPERVLDGRERVAAMVPIVPTVERMFAKTDRVTAFLKIYEGGGAVAPIDAHIKIVDDHDRPIVDRTEQLPPSRFDGQRSASIAVPLPLGTLVPGDYLLSIEAARGKTTARRELRFSVK